MKNILEELRRLQAQIDNALWMTEQTPFVELSPDEQLEHDRKYGPGIFLVGDYVIRKR